MCFIANADVAGVPAPPSLAIAVQSPVAGVTVTCVAQTGYYDNGNIIRSTAVRSHTFEVAPASVYLEWAPGSLARQSPVDVVTLNCKVPPQVRLGLIQYAQ